MLNDTVTACSHTLVTSSTYTGIIRTNSATISLDHCSEGWSCWTSEHAIYHNNPSLQ